MQRITINTTPELKQRLEECAAKEFHSVSSFVLRVMSQYMAGELLPPGMKPVKQVKVETARARQEVLESRLLHYTAFDPYREPTDGWAACQLDPEVMEVLPMKGTSDFKRLWKWFRREWCKRNMYLLEDPEFKSYIAAFPDYPLSEDDMFSSYRDWINDRQA